MVQCLIFCRIMAICGTFATWRHLSLPFDIEYDKSLSVSTSRSRLPHPVRELSIHAVKQKYSFQKPEWKGNENGKCLSQLQNPVFFLIVTSNFLYFLKVKSLRQMAELPEVKTITQTGFLWQEPKNQRNDDHSVKAHQMVRSSHQSPMHSWVVVLWSLSQSILLVKRGHCVGDCLSTSIQSFHISVFLHVWSSLYPF